MWSSPGGKGGVVNRRSASSSNKDDEDGTIQTSMSSLYAVLHVKENLSSRRNFVLLGMVFLFILTTDETLLQLTPTMDNTDSSSVYNNGVALLGGEEKRWSHTARDYYPDHTKVPSWIEAYIKFHESQIVMDNVTNTPRLKPGAKYLLYSCESSLCGGLGDRTNGIVTLFYVAMTTGRVLLINHPKPKPLTTVLKPNRVWWDIPKSTLPMNSAPERCARNLFNFPYLMEPCELETEPQGHVIQTNQWYGEEFIWDSKCMKRYWEKLNITLGSNETGAEDYHKMYRWAFWTLFRFEESVLDRADQIRKSSGLELDHVRVSKNVDLSNESKLTSLSMPPHFFKPYIGVHIRGERFAGEKNNRKFLECAQKLQNATLKETKGKDERLIFIADDSYDGIRQDVKPMIQSWYPVSVRISNDTVVTHIDLSRDKGNAFVDAYADLVILMDSECLVRSRSGFSELPHRITLSNEVNFQRCGIQFDKCSDIAVQGSVQTLDWVSANTDTLDLKDWDSWAPKSEIGKKH